jgi:PAS domain S-box-containing protein
MGFEKQKTPPPGREALRVIVVHANAAFLSQALDEEALDAVYVDNLLEASQRLEHETFDAVLLGADSAHAPDLSGVREVHEKAPRVPLIAVTDMSNYALTEDLLRAGAQDHLANEDVNGYMVKRAVRNAILRQASLSALEEAEERFRLIIENSADGMLMLDPDGCILYSNPAAQKMLAKTESQLLGRSFGYPAVPGEMCELEIQRGAQKAISVEMRITDIVWRGRNVKLADLRDITERREAERQVRELARFPRENPSPVLRVGADGRILYANDAALDIPGLGDGLRESYLSAEWTELLLDVSRSKSVRAARECVIGDRVFLLTASRPASEEYLNIYMFDISEQKKAEESIGKLRNELTLRSDLSKVFLDAEPESLEERALRIIMAASGSGVGMMTEVARDAAELNCTVVAGGKVEQHVLPRTQLCESARACVESRENIRRNEEWTMPPLPHPIKNGLFVPLEDKSGGRGLIVLGDKADDYTEEDERLAQSLAEYISGVLAAYWQNRRAQDQRRKAEERLAQSEERFRTLIENSHDIFTVLSSDGLILYESPSAKRVSGYELAERLGTDAFEQVHADDADIVQKALQEAVATPGEVRSSVFRQRHKNGSWQVMESAGRAVSMPGLGDCVVIVNTRDVTDRVRAEEERRRLAEAVEHAAEMIYITDTKGVIEYVNPAFEEITGFSEKESVGQHTRILKSGRHDDDFYKALWACITQGRVWSGQLSDMRKDGSVFDKELTISPIFGQAGEIVNFVAVARDVTDEQQLEKQLRQSQKMEAIGALAGGIAHDFNNVLAAILGYTQMAREDLPQGSSAQEDLQHVIEAGERARDLVRQILTFSRKGEEERRPLSVDSVVKESLKLLSATLPSTITVKSSIEEDCPSILGDATQIHQIIMNLGTNAYHAMRETGGELSVAMECFTADDRFARRHPKVVPGRYILIKVADTGCGMDPETAERCFEPFFTTKEKGEGTGLGMATVHSIVTAHGGSIELETTPGEGTEIALYFPALEEESSVEQTAQEPPRGGSEHLLVADDEQPLVQMLEAALRRFGYRVTATSNSGQALSIFLKHPGAFDAVIADRTMPGLTGDELIEEVHRVRPKLPAVLTTGAADESVSGLLEKLGAHYLPKPSTTYDIARVVRTALDAGAENKDG